MGFIFFLVVGVLCTAKGIDLSSAIAKGAAPEERWFSVSILYFVGFASFYLARKVLQLDSRKAERLGPKRRDSPPTDADIRALGEARLQQLKPKAKHEPLLAVHVGGSGIPIQTGSAFYLSCREGAFAISHAISDEEVELRYEKIKNIEVSGPGTEVTNAGLVGGGFGLEGALKGMAAAALVNAATTKKATNTFLRIATNEGEAYFHFNNIEPAALRLVLSPVVVAVEANKDNTKSSVTLGLASELEKLHQLKMNGVITDEEFEASKKKIITAV